MRSSRLVAASGLAKSAAAELVAINGPQKFMNLHPLLTRLIAQSVR